MRVGSTPAIWRFLGQKARVAGRQNDTFAGQGWVAGRQKAVQEGAEKRVVGWQNEKLQLEYNDILTGT
jgi:hypothetical protein